MGVDWAARTLLNDLGRHPCVQHEHVGARRVPERFLTSAHQRRLLVRAGLGCSVGLSEGDVAWKVPADYCNQAGRLRIKPQISGLIQSDGTSQQSGLTQRAGQSTP